MNKKLYAILLSLGISGISLGQNVEAPSSEEYMFKQNIKKCKPRQVHRKKMLLNKLPQEKKMLFGQVMADAKAQSKPLHRDVQNMKKELNLLLNSDEFDDAAFLAKSSEIGLKKKEIANIKQAAVVRLANSFDQQERQILAKLLQIKCHKVSRRRSARGIKL